MIKMIYKNSLNILAKMPFKLWGLSLLSGFLTILITIFGVLPIITIPVISVIHAGMAIVYLDGYKGKEVYSDQLFKGFTNFAHVAGGMCWRKLWILLWLLVPVVGIVMFFIKSFEYSFTPYILNEEPSVSATEALRKSKSDTKGYKAKMFLAIMLPSIGFIVAILILALFSQIPYVGVLFAFIMFVVSLVYSLFAPLFFGLVQAGFYEYSKNPIIPSYPQFNAPTYTAPTAPAAPVSPTPTNNTSKSVCPVCDSENNSDSAFCYKCGAKLK